MIDLNKEAEEYSSYVNDYVPLQFGIHDYNEGYKNSFIAGANSKYVKQQLLQAQIDVLEKSVEKNGEKPLTNKWLLSILKQTQRKIEKEEADADFYVHDPNWD